MIVFCEWGGGGSKCTRCKRDGATERKKFISCGRKKIEKRRGAKRKKCTANGNGKNAGKNVQTAGKKKERGWVVLGEEVEARLQCEKKNLEISATTAADKRRRRQRAAVGWFGMAGGSWGWPAVGGWMGYSGRSGWPNVRWLLLAVKPARWLRSGRRLLPFLLFLLLFGCPRWVLLGPTPLGGGHPFAATFFGDF